MKKALFPGMINNIRTLSDKSIKIDLYTEDHSKHPGLFEKLGQLQQVPGMVYITEGNINEEQQEELDKQQVREFMVKKPKTPAQKLRNAIYVYWEQHITDQSSDNFYDQEMDKIIKKYLEQLD